MHRTPQAPRFPKVCKSRYENDSFKKSLNHALTLRVQAPKGLEKQIPDAVHDTGSNKETGKVSHATGDSVVPQALQEGLPESVKKAVPNAIHDTSGAKFSDGSKGT